jgi:hypothetical protein
MKMLKLLVVLGVLGGGGYFLYTKVLRPPEKTVCVKLADLCGGEQAKAHVDRCEQTMLKLKKAGGGKAVDKAAKCIGEVDTCPKAVGCIIGASMSSVGEMLEGMKKALEK